MTKKKQYGFAMAKPLPIGCIKNTPPFWLKFSLMIKTVDSDGDIGHLILIDIEFNEKDATEQTMYSDIFPPIIEKHYFRVKCEITFSTS